MTVENPSLALISRGALTALLFFAQAIQAQRVETTFDVGGVVLRYADTLNAGAATITPRVIAEWERAAAEATATYSQFSSGGGSAQGAISGSLFSPTTRGVLAELAGFAGGSAHLDGTRTGQMLANGRVHFIHSSSELFIGAGGGRTWVGGGSGRVLMGEAGASGTLGRVDATVTVSPVAVDDSIKYTDGQLSLSWQRGQLDLGAVLGTRVGDRLTTLGGSTRSWGSLSAVAWMTPRFALVASGGTYPIDPTQGFPGGRFLSLSIRLAPGRNREAQSMNPEQHAEAGPDQAAPRSDEEPAVVTGFAAVRTSPDMVTLRVNAPQAQAVEVSGDFTEWAPVPLERASDGWWAVTLPINPGKYQMNLRLDGSKWLVPPGVLSMLDEFGGTVGLLVVQ